jgi:hypothetical protein
MLFPAGTGLARAWRLLFGGLEPARRKRVCAVRDAVMHLKDHPACRGLEQARDDGVHQGRESGAEQTRRKAEREQEMFSI